jgi:hypothetical protein
MKNIFIVYFFTSVLCKSVLAQQDADLFHLKYSITPMNHTSGNDVLHEFEANIKVPTILRKNSTVVTGIKYESLLTDGQSLPMVQALHGTSTQLFFGRKLKTNDVLMAVLSVGIYSDFKDITSDDFRFAAGIRYKNQISEKLSFSYGLLYSKQFFGNLIAPFIDFNWKISRQLSLHGPFPLNPRLYYTIHPKASLSLFLKPDNSTFRLSARENNAQYLQRKQWNAGIGFDYNVKQHWTISIRTGASLRQRFELYDASETGVFSILTIDVNGRKRTPSYSYEANSFFAEIVLAWSLHQNE